MSYKNMGHASGARIKREIDCHVISTHRIVAYARVARYSARMFDEMNMLLNKNFLISIGLREDQM